MQAKLDSIILNVPIAKPTVYSNAVLHNCTIQTAFLALASEFCLYHYALPAITPCTACSIPATIHRDISFRDAIRYDTQHHDIDIVVSTRIRGVPAARRTIVKNVCRVRAASRQVKVQLQEQGVETLWFPWISLRTPNSVHRTHSINLIIT